MKKYISILEKSTNTRANFLRVELYYSLGGFNCFTYKTEERGYYLGVTPVERSELGTGVMMESVTAFSGIKTCILPVTRKSAKAEKNAENIAPEMEKQMIDYICKKYGLTLGPVEAVNV